MTNNLSKFLQGFVDEDEDSTEHSVSVKEQKEEKLAQESMKEIQDENENTYKSVKKISEESKQTIKSDTLGNYELAKEINKQVDSKVNKKNGMVLNLKLKAITSDTVHPDTKMTDVDKPVIKPELKKVIKEKEGEDAGKNEIDEDKDLENLFKKSGTPEEMKEKWMFTIKKARKSHATTMLNRKVCAGKFRFSSIGELEILPDLDTYGKSSKQIISMQWQ